MNINYHNWRDYTECPKKFRLLHVEKVLPTVLENEYYTLYGKLVQRFFEFYCNIWRFKTPYLFKEVIQERMDKILEGMLLTRDVNWSVPGAVSKDQIVEQATNDASVIMEGPTLNYFLATQAEVSIEIKLSSGDLLNGRIDFVHINVDKTCLIFDGKGTGTKGKNISRDQLLFYSLLYFLHSKQLPDYLGFFYWKLNEFEPVGFNLDLLNEFRARLSLDIKAMTSGMRREATPSAKSCKHCPYLNICQEGLGAKGKRARKSKMDIEGDGLVVFGL